MRLLKNDGFGICHDVSHRLSHAISLCFALLFSVLASPAAQPDGFNDGIDRTDPNFIKASLLWIGPGNEFFGCAGHSSIRLECPKFNLDYCFSCESESIRDNFFRFLMGDLKTGMFAIPTSEFLKLYSDSGRGARQYTLNLPPDVKQRLWKILDEKVAAGRCLPYDYIKYCCVQTMLQPLLEAIPPGDLKLPPWPEERYKLTRREMLAIDLDWCKWNGAFLELIAGTEVDQDVNNIDKVILSGDFVELLRGATVRGVPVIADEGKELLPQKEPVKGVPFTPTMAAGIVLFVALANLFLKKKFLDWCFLAFQSVIGLFLSHLMFISSLPATGWNWLFVLFNPLPLIFWKWRRKWALGYAGVLLAWIAFMLLHPHRLTGPAYLTLAAAYALMYARIGWLMVGARVSRDRNGRAGCPATTA